jgi:hypothetical protein
MIAHHCSTHFREKQDISPGISREGHLIKVCGVLRTTSVRKRKIYGRLRSIVAWRKNSRGWQKNCAKTRLVRYSTVYKVS